MVQPGRGASRPAQGRLSSAATHRAARDAAEGGVANQALKHLEKVIKSVKAVSGVLDVERVYR